jgi:hypothetical protein
MTVLAIEMAGGDCEAAGHWALLPFRVLTLSVY